MGTSHEDNLIRRHCYNETAPLEDNLTRKQTHNKTASREDNLKRRQTHKKAPGQENKLQSIIIGDEGRGSRRKKYDILFEQSLINHKAVKCGTSSWRYMKLPKVLHRIYFLNILYNVFECFIARCLFYFLKKVIFVLLALS